MKQAYSPVDILLPQRPVESILLLEELNLREIRRLSRFLEFGNIGGEVISLRQVNYREYYYTDRDQGRDHNQQAVHDIAEHFVSTEEPARPSTKQILRNPQRGQ